MGSVRRSRLLPVLLFVMAAIVLGAPTAASAVNVGDTFPDGSPAVTYLVTSATTVQVGDGLNRAVGAGTGMVAIPPTVDKDGTTYSVTAIGHNAFNGCTALTSVSIPASVKSIGDRAFKDCTVLPTITLPGSVLSIGANVFDDCIGLKTVNLNSGLKSIGAFAFTRCSALTGLTIPSTVDSIGNYALYLCESLTSVSFSMPSSLGEIPRGMFSSCTALPAVQIPSTVTSIGDYAFSGCDKLASIQIPNSVKSIGEAAFFNCVELKTASLGNSIESLGARAFYECVRLTTVNLPSSISSIGDSAFYGCTSLSSAIVIPSPVATISARAFQNCSSLTSVTIPSSVTAIGEMAFFNCQKLTSVTIQGAPTFGTLAFNTVLSKSLDGVDPFYPFTGDPIRPTVTPKTAMGTIPAGGFEVTYQNDIAASPNAQVTVTGQGSYVGTVFRTFEITKAPLTSATIEITLGSFVYTGAAITPAPKVMLGAKTLTTADYTTVYSNNTAVGTASVTVIGKGNYKDSPAAPATFQITQASLAGATISGIATNYAHTGGAITPVPQVVLGGRTLPSSDYTVTYANNINNGTATVTVTGKGNCTGSASKTFSIVSPATVSGKITASFGGAAMSGATVTMGDRTTTTASNGTFAFTGLVPGAYTVTVKKAGYVTKSMYDVPVTVGARVTANIALSRDVKQASIARKPNVSKVTYARKRGVAKFTLSSTMKGWGSSALSNRTVYLQTSTNGKTWKSTYKLKTSATGKVSKVFKIKTKQVRFYRWYVPSKSQVNLKTYSPSTKVTVK